MTTSLKAIFFLASALCILSLGTAHAEHPENYIVEGKVYCDNCRVQFVTRISKYMAGAKVRLECRHREDGEVVHSIDGETDESGTYHLKMEGEHEEEICEVSLVESSDPECNEIDKETYLRRSARISLTKDNGISSASRLANPIGFMAKEPAPECAEVLRELGLTPFGIV